MNGGFVRLHFDIDLLAKEAVAEMKIDINHIHGKAQYEIGNEEDIKPLYAQSQRFNDPNQIILIYRLNGERDLIVHLRSILNSFELVPNLPYGQIDVFKIKELEWRVS